MDYYYTSIPLLYELADMHIWACGTIRTNRKGLHPDVCMKKSEETAQKKKTPGFIQWCSYGPLCLVAWFAKRPVHILTNCYMPTSDGDEGSVMHWFTRNGEKIQEEIRRPPPQ